MSLTHLPLVATYIQTITGTIAAPAAVYDNPNATKAYIRGWRLFNTHTVVETVDIYIVQAGAGPALGVPAAVPHQTFHYEIGPKGWIQEDFPPDGIELVNQHDAVFAGATDASKVNLVLFGTTDA